MGAFCVRFVIPGEFPMPTEDARPEPVSNPHDTYAKSVFRETPQARGFFCGYLPDEVRRALYYLMSVTDKDQEAEVRQALQSIQAEFLPVKEHIMTLLEHLEQRGRIGTLVRLLSAGFPEFSAADADRVRDLPSDKLDELTDAIAMRRTWAEIERILQQRG
jgi:hypothetical protein